MSKSTLLALLLTAAATGAGLWWWQQAANSDQSNTVASQWRWDGFDREKVGDAWQRAQRATQGLKSAPAGSSEPGEDETAETNNTDGFNVVMIYHALGDVALDANGRPVLDDRARRQLVSAFNQLPDTLSDEQLAELQELIRVGLPGPGGAEVAAIVENFYYYRVAERELHATFPAADTPSQAMAQYEQIIDLRQAHLGPNVANQLYRQEQSHARYTYQHMMIQADPNLTDEEKQQQLAQLRTAVAEQVPGMVDPRRELERKEQALRDQGASEEELHALRVDMLGKEEAQRLAEEEARQQDWEQRYAAFRREKQYILDAGLSAQDQRKAVDDLLAKYFEPEEIAGVRAYDQVQN